MNFEIKDVVFKKDAVGQHISNIIPQNTLRREDIQKLFVEAQEIYCQRMETSSFPVVLITRGVDVLDSSQPEWKGASQNEIKFVKKLLAKEAEEDSLYKLVRIIQGIKTLDEELGNLEGEKVRIRHIRKKFNVHLDYPPREKALINFFNVLQSTKKEFNEVNSHYEKLLKTRFHLERDLTSTEQLLIRRALKIDFLISKIESLEKVYNEKLKKIKVSDPKFIIDSDDETVLQKTPNGNPFMFLNMERLLGVNIENLLETNDGK